MTADRHVALVLSGGAINGVLMQLGFLKRIRESELWPRVGWIFGTSAGALAGTMAALDRLDDFEEFLLDLRPDDVFRPNRLWRLPLLGLHEYALPETIAGRVGNLEALAEELSHAERELVVFASDVTDTHRRADHNFELAYSSRTSPPAEMAQAILASAAISTLVLPLRVGDRIATDGAWTRNFPLGYAYERPEVECIVAFRYLPNYPKMDARALRSLRDRLRPFRGVPPVRALIAELEQAEAREARGEPPHLVEMITRLMRLSVLRGTELEERVADEQDASIAELARLREDVLALVPDDVAPAVDACFDDARFPFRRHRRLPRIMVRASAGDDALDARFKNAVWTRSTKRSLIDRGYELTDDALAAAALGSAAPARP